MLPPTTTWQRCLEEGDREGAKYTLQKALALKPTAARHNNFANLLSEDGDHAGAQRHYEAAIALDAGDKYAHLGLGRLLQLAFFDFAGARREYETAVAIDPGFATARYNLAVLLASDAFGDVSGARMHYEAALRYDPNDPATNWNLGVLLRDHFQDYAAARVHIEAARSSRGCRESDRKRCDAALRELAVREKQPRSP